MPTKPPPFHEDIWHIDPGCVNIDARCTHDMTGGGSSSLLYYCIIERWITYSRVHMMCTCMCPWLALFLCVYLLIFPAFSPQTVVEEHRGVTYFTPGPNLLDSESITHFTSTAVGKQYTGTPVWPRDVAAHDTNRTFFSTYINDILTC